MRKHLETICTMIKVLVIIRRIDWFIFSMGGAQDWYKTDAWHLFSTICPITDRFFVPGTKGLPNFCSTNLNPVVFSRHTLAINMSRSYALWCDHIVLLYFFVRSIIAEMKETRRPNNIGANTVSSSVTTKYTDRIKENTREPIMLIFFISEHPFW